MINGQNNYIFLDESGKPEVYSAKGKNLVEAGFATKFLIIAAIRTNDQLKIQQDVTEFRLSLMKDSELTKIFSSSYTLDNFHAHNDYPEVRERFYNFIRGLDIKIDVIAIEKLKCYEPLKRNPGRLYGAMAGQLLKNICHQAENTEIIFSRKDSKLKLRQELEIEVELVRIQYMNDHNNLDDNFKLVYHHNPHYTHGALQIVDYIAYAVFKYYEKGDPKWLSIINPQIGKIHDICNKKYFTKSNPLQLST